MAFVLSRTSSPNNNTSSSRGSLHIDSPSGPLPHANPHTPPVADHTHPHHDMAKEKDPKPRIEILLDTPYLFLKGVGVDVEPTRLSGHVAIYLSEATPIKEITLQFRGKARLPVPPSELPLTTAPLTYTVCNHDWSFLEGDRHTSHTLKAGRHLFPFQLRIGGSLPSTIASPAFGGAAVSYKLHAQVVRTGFFNHWQTFQAGLPVHIIRSFAPEAMEYQQTLEIENTWPAKLMYSIMVPHKAWAAGDKLTALVKFSPLVKGVYVLSVATSIHEQTKVYARNGPQEQTRLVASTKHEIVNGRTVEVEDHRTGHSRTPSNPSSPASPASPSFGFTNASRSNSSTSLSSLGRQYFSHTPLRGFTSSTSVATPASELPPSVPSPSSSTAEETSVAETDSQDVVTYLSIHVPLTVTPTHSLEPIIVSHRIRWNILILNLDGHTSELRCSLPLHLLDYRLLNESRNLSAATRRLLIGGAEVPSTEEEDVQLPSYNQHIRDRVANMFLPDSATMRVTNPWITQHASPVPSADAPATFWPITSSGSCTPLEAHLLTNLPHQPDPNASNTPLEWVNSELLLSLSQQAPPRLRARSPQREAGPSSQPLTRTTSRSRPGSRVLSRLSSRNNSPERDRGRDRGHTLAAHANETYLHNGNTDRNSHGVFSATMKPSSSFNPGGFLSRSTSSQHLPSTAEVEAASRPAQPIHTISVGRNSGTDLLHRAFTEVPDYSVASRGFIGGVPPLSSMQGLPSYDESLRTNSEEDVTRRLGQLNMSPLAPESSPISALASAVST